MEEKIREYDIKIIELEDDVNIANEELLTLKLDYSESQALVLKQKERILQLN